MGNILLNPAFVWLGNRELAFMPLTGGGSIIVDTAITSLIMPLVVTLFVASGTRREIATGRITCSEWRLSGLGAAVMATKPGVGSWSDHWSGSRARAHTAHLHSVQPAGPCWAPPLRRVCSVQGGVDSSGGDCRGALGGLASTSASPGDLIHGSRGNPVSFTDTSSPGRHRRKAPRDHTGKHLDRSS